MISSPIEEIKNRLDIAEVIGGYIKLSKAGANFRAPCPFHSEKKPSFFVSPARQIWHCFGCNSGGDIFKFVMQVEGLEFGDALRLLAQKAGVELKRQDPQLRSERERLYEICELACRFFEKQLEQGAIGKEAEQYLLKRSISKESLKKWRVGYSPDVWQGLSDFLTTRGYRKDEIQRAGLALTSEKGSFYDRFRGRIIFPIFDLNSQVVGFGGRVFKSDDPAKYLNSPSTLLYDKSRILYGLDKARMEIRKKGFVILVEGYVDLILASQAGTENVVATSGTALTPYQLQILKRYSENLNTAFDMDPAGDSATKRGIDLAQAQGFNVRIITMPGEKDPADVISHNPGEWEKLAGQTKSILEFYFDTTFSKISPETPEGKREISKILLPVIKRIQNKIERAYWVQQLSKKLQIKEEAIEEELGNTKLSLPQEALPEMAPQPVFAAAKTRKEILGERIASLAISSGNLDMIQDHIDCLPENIRGIIVDLREQKPPRDPNLANFLALKAEAEEDEPIDCRLEIETCLREIGNLDVKKELNGMSQDIRKAEDEKNFDKVGDLIQRFKETANKLTNI